MSDEAPKTEGTANATVDPQVADLQKKIAEQADLIGKLRKIEERAEKLYKPVWQKEYEGLKTKPTVTAELLKSIENLSLEQQWNILSSLPTPTVNAVTIPKVESQQSVATAQAIVTESRPKAEQLSDPYEQEITRLETQYRRKLTPVERMQLAQKYRGKY